MKQLARFSLISIICLSSLACSLISQATSNPTQATATSSISITTQRSTPTVSLEATGQPTPDITSIPDETQETLNGLPTLIPVIDTNNDGKIDICESVPVAVWETVMGRSLVGSPTPFQDEALGDGCAFDFGQDSCAAYFAYVTFANEAQFNEALTSATRAEPVTSIGDSAFLNYGADARQLWVRVGNQAVLVAIGDEENVSGMVIVAPYLIQAHQSTP